MQCEHALLPAMICNFMSLPILLYKDDRPGLVDVHEAPDARLPLLQVNQPAAVHAQETPATAAPQAMSGPQQSLEEVQRLVLDVVRDLVGGEVDPAVALGTQGLDSLAAMELRQKLQVLLACSCACTALSSWRARWRDVSAAYTWSMAARCLLVGQSLRGALLNRSPMCAGAPGPGAGSASRGPCRRHSSCHCTGSLQPPSQAAGQTSPGSGCTGCAQQHAQRAVACPCASIHQAAPVLPALRRRRVGERLR